jgi:hypothetical protein
MIKKNLAISGIVGILLGLLLLIACIIKFRPIFTKMKDICLTRHSSIGRISIQQSVVQAMNHYRVANRTNKRQSRKYTLATIDENDGSVEEMNSRQDSVIVKYQSVEIEC